MTRSTFKILRQCIFCSKMFEAGKVTSKYCSQKCNSKHYKLKVKLAKKGEAEKHIVNPDTMKPKVSVLNFAFIKDKEFLTVKEVAFLFSCSKHTVYKMIESSNLKAVNLSERKTLIKRSEIDKLFEQPQPITPEPELKELEISDCYSISEASMKFDIPETALRSLISRNNVPRIKKGWYAYVPKTVIDKLLS